MSSDIKPDDPIPSTSRLFKKPSDRILKIMQKQPGLKRGCFVLYETGKDHFTVIAVTCGWGPSYQYRKPSTSTVSPTLRFFTAS